MPNHSSKFNLAIVGVTGAVGGELLKLLKQRRFDIEKIRCFASSQSVGKTVWFQEKPIVIEALVAGCFQGIDIVFFVAGKEVSLRWAYEAAEGGSVVIDGSSAFRKNPLIPLIIPEINGHLLKGYHGIISSPNCTTTIMLLALAPLHRAFNIKRIVTATYQSASGAGRKAMAELEEETRAVLNQKSFERTVMRFPYAFNLFTHDAPVTASRYNEEEEKVIEECRKILEEPTLRIAITCVRVPVLRAHSIALNVEFENFVTVLQTKEILQQSPGLFVLEEWEQNRFPMPIDASNQDEVFVGRIRNDHSNPNTLDLWLVGDQLLKGAALNLIQIAELIKGS